MSKKIELEKTETTIAHILRWGVLLCAIVILVGWIISFKQLTMSGLLMLIFLPIIRVFAALVIFLKQKDYIYVCLSAYVFIVLVASLMLGKTL